MIRNWNCSNCGMLNRPTWRDRDTDREERDRMAQLMVATLEQNDLLAAGVSFRYGADLVQVLRDGVVVATWQPSAVVGS